MASTYSDPNPPAVAETHVATATRPPTPRWVKVFGIVGIILVVLIVGVVVASMAGIGPDHGPGRHFGGHEPSDTNHTRPSDHHSLTVATAEEGESTPEPISANPARRILIRGIL